MPDTYLSEEERQRAVEAARQLLGQGGASSPEDLQRIKSDLLMNIGRQGGDLTSYQNREPAGRSMRPELDRTAAIIAEDPQLQKQLDASKPYGVDMAGVRVRPRDPSTLELEDVLGPKSGWKAPAEPPPGGPPPPQMAKSAGALQDMALGGSQPKDELSLMDRFAGSTVGRFAADVMGSSPTFRMLRGQSPGEAYADSPIARLLGGVQGAGAPPAAPPALPPPTSAPQPPQPRPPTTVQVGRPVDVRTPNTALVQSAAPAVDLGPAVAPSPRAAAGPPPEAVAASRRLLGVPEAASGLDAALQAARDNRFIANMARAGGTAIGRGNAPGYESLEEQAGVPLQEYALRQADAERRRQEALRLAPADAITRSVFARMMQQSGVQVDPAALETMTRQQLESAMPGLGKLVEGERQMEIERMRAKAKVDAARAKRGGGMGGPSELDIPGLQRTGTPSKMDARFMKAFLPAAQIIDQNLKKMEEIYGRKGAEFLYGADQATSETSREDIILKLKELEGLGALQRHEVDLLARIIPDPNSIRGAVDKPGMRARFAAFRDQMSRYLSANAASRGYQVQPRTIGPQRSGKIVVSDGAETLEIDEADLEDAAKDGFRPVE